jgi:hypothetical protein
VSPVIESSKGDFRMPSIASFTSANLDCSHCGASFSVAASVGKSIEKIPDPFTARCPHCGTENIYEKTAIQSRAYESPAYNLPKN